MEYLQTTASTRYSPEELFWKFWKIPKKTSLKKSCFYNDGESRHETLLKHDLTVLKQGIYLACMLKVILLTGT